MVPVYSLFFVQSGVKLKVATQWVGALRPSAVARVSHGTSLVTRRDLGYLFYMVKPLIMEKHTP